MNKLCYEDLFPTRSVASGRDTVMRRRRSGEKYRSPGEDDFSSEDGGPPAAFRMTIFPDGNREEKEITQKFFRMF
ncbi:hypothetical protein B5G09_07100 [Alistipes sp. An54]|uniref:hypothetical protein n=1 Tax=Alistipes sp. An54 TaxID=1965645 RepID=UPI000B36C64E|nr:hypothetical protein [Alistipes sp. An54]OUN77162.1 hypothetical protein B5G09_07100 [Alistipes sp. An54]